MSMNILAIPTTFGLSKPISGGQNRFSNSIKELKKRENNVVVLESEDLVDSNDIKIANIYSYKDFKIFNRTLTIFRGINIYFILKLIKILKNENINLIQITHPSGIFTLKILTKLMRKKIPIFYDAHNVESDFVNETFKNNKKYTKLERFLIPKYTTILEKIMCEYFINYITSVSENDKEIFILKYKIKKERITVIPSGCYIPKSKSKKHKANIKKEIKIDSDKIIVFFHGLFSHSPNKDAFGLIENYICPEFWKINKKVLFVTGGTGVPKRKKENFKSLGFIEDLYDVMSLADIAIVPLRRGAGTKIKIFDYLALGLPIVTTKKGIEGIKAENGKHALIVDDVNEDFISAINYLVGDKKERERLGANALRLAEKEYDWNKIGEKLNRLYKKILMNW